MNVRFEKNIAVAIAAVTPIGGGCNSLRMYLVTNSFG